MSGTVRRLRATCGATRATRQGRRIKRVGSNLSKGLRHTHNGDRGTPDSGDEGPGSTEVASPRWEPARYDVFAVGKALALAGQDDLAADAVIGYLSESGYLVAVDAGERDYWLTHLRPQSEEWRND